REERIFELLNILKNDNNIKFRFFIINGNSKTGDAEITDNFINRLSLKEDRYELIPYNPNTIEVISKLVECSLVFSVRLHFAIFSATQNIPSLLVEYHQKCKDYLDDIGVSDEYRIGDMNINAIDVVSKIYSILYKKQYNFYPKKEELIKLSEKNFLDENIMNIFYKSKN
ncbi:MAG: polysaccharide pyruvyl transferase family protein, partial [Sulfurovaceae bacterium]|nr:polysaccharide pyruvyl transferase family protein [Sulfurovaceae bacterium]